MRIKLIGFGAALLGACANDPVYLPQTVTLEGGVPDATGMTAPVKSSLQIPFKPETQADMDTRMALTTQLGVDVPYIKVGDVDLEVEWTVTNLDSMPGQFVIELNGANEVFAYDPTMILLDPGDDEAPPTPGLSGDIPTDIAANQSISGTFREDQLLEAAIDLDQITRGNMNPFAAMLTVSKNVASFQPMTMYDPTMPDAMQTPTGAEIPRAAFRGFIRIDIVFTPSTHMEMNYTVRARDHRGIIHDHGVDAPVDQLWIVTPPFFTI
jgi:hypothetical protein